MLCVYVYVGVQLPGKQSSSTGVRSSLLQILLEERNSDRTSEKLLAMTLDTHTGQYLFISSNNRQYKFCY